MEMTRREFGRKVLVVGTGARLALAAGAIGVSLELEGCNVIADIKSWVPVGIDAFNGLVNLLESNGLLNPLVGGALNGGLALVDGALNQLLSDVQQYQAVQPPPVGALQKIVEGLKIVANNFQNFLQSVNISDAKLASLVTGIADLFLSTIAGFEGQLPNTPTGSLVARTYRVGSLAATVTPQKRSIKTFKKSYNQLMWAGNRKDLCLRLSLTERVGL